MKSHILKNYYCPKYFPKTNSWFTKKGRKISCLFLFWLKIAMKLITYKNKEKFFNQIPVFGQLVALVNQADVEMVIQKTEVD
jgi:hypothetical protein